jgi:hypothetical protein
VSDEREEDGMAGDDPDLAATVSAVLATVAGPDPGADRLLGALADLRAVQAQLAALEPVLIRAARDAGASWQQIAPALGVASRQAAERRYLRLLPAAAPADAGTRDERVRAERDRRAGQRAVAQWANDNTADLRRLAGQITALSDLDTAASGDLGRLHEALGDPDAADLPALLAETQRHLRAHPDLARQIDEVVGHTDAVRRRVQRQRDGRSA